MYARLARVVNGDKQRHYLSRWLLMMAITAVGTAGLASILLGLPDTDESVFLLVGREMRLGSLPYRDLWDHKGLPIYFIGYIASFFGTYYAQAGRLLALLLPLSGGLTLFRLLELRWSKTFSLIFLSLGMAVTTSIAQGMMTEQLEAGTILWALVFLLAAKKYEGPSSTKRAIFAVGGGIFIGIAICTRIPAIIYLVGAVLWFFAQAFTQRSLRHIFYSFLTVLGALFPVMAMVGLLLDWGIWDDFLVVYLQGNLQYAQHNNLSLIEFAQQIRRTVMPHILAVHAAFFVLGFQGLEQISRKSPAALLLPWFAGLGLVEAMVTLGGRYPHYWASAFWLLAFASAYAIWRYYQELKGQANIGHTMGLIFLLTLLSMSASRPLFASLLYPRHTYLSAEISRDVKPGSRLWVAGTTGGALYLYTNMRPGSRYIYTEAAARLALSPSKLIEDLRVYQPVIVASSKWYGVNGFDENLPGEVRQFLVANYVEDRIFQDPTTGQSYTLFTPRSSIAINNLEKAEK